MEGKEGWVYVLINEAMPGLLKIGWTMKDPAIRAEDLYKDPKTGGVTGVPMPFILVYKALVVSPRQVERKVHDTLKENRINPDREFFRCRIDEAMTAIEKVAKVVHKDSIYRPINFIKFPDGKRYFGQTLGDLPHDNGEMTGVPTPGKLSDTIRGKWDRGVLSGVVEQTLEEEVYIGEWKDGQRNGKGSLIKFGKYYYIGEFENDKRHGEGYEIPYNEDWKYAIWEDDELVDEY